jgi:hypothetical protein
MADGFKVLAAKSLATIPGAPYANTEASLIYEVPSPSGERFGTRGNSQAIFSSMTVCHHAAGSGNYSIRLVQAADRSPSLNIDDSQYLIFHKAISANDTDVLSFGIGLVSGDAIYASVDSGSAINIHIFGTEAL